jgi:hypothetical protein
MDLSKRAQDSAHATGRSVMSRCRTLMLAFARDSISRSCLVRKISQADISAIRPRVSWQKGSPSTARASTSMRVDFGTLLHPLRRLPGDATARRQTLYHSNQSIEDRLTPGLPSFPSESFQTLQSHRKWSDCRYKILI